MQEKQIAIVINTLCCGGAERFSSIIANQFVNQGHKVDLIVFNAANCAYEIDPRVNIINFKRKSIWQTPWVILKLIRSIKRGNYDGIFSIMKSNTLQLLFSSFFVGHCPPIFTRECTYQSLSLESTLWSKFVFRFMYKYLYRRVTKVIALTQAMKSDLVLNFSVSQDKIKVIFNPVIEVDKSKLIEVKHPFFAAQVPVIIACANLTDKKDYQTLIKAMAVLKKTAKFKLIILGEGPQRRTLQNLIDELELQNDIDLFGATNEVLSFYNQADIFVLCSKFEGFPNVLVEAMACGLPVVATDCLSGPAEIIVEGQNGFLVPKENPDIIAQRIFHLISNPAIASEISRNALAFTRANLRPQAIASQYLKAFFSATKS